MTTRRRLREAKRRRSRRIRALLAAGAVFGVGAAGTLAAWNDSEYATTTITAGTFGIVSRADQEGFMSHETDDRLAVPLDAAGLYPGQKRVAYVQIRTASGSVPGEVNLTAASVTDAAGAALSQAKDIALSGAIRVSVAVVSPETTGNPNCTVDMDFDATVTGLGSLPSLPSQLLAAAGGNTVSYCIMVELPLNAPDGAQGGNVRANWTFTGTSGE